MNIVARRARRLGVGAVDLDPAVIGRGAIDRPLDGEARPPPVQLGAARDLAAGPCRRRRSPTSWTTPAVFGQRLARSARQRGDALGSIDCGMQVVDDEQAGDEIVVEGGADRVVRAPLSCEQLEGAGEGAP